MRDSAAPMASLGFGCGDLYGGGQAAASRALIEAAWAAGIRHFDVARLYGDGSAEGVVGEALQPVRREATIVSKAGIIPWSMRLGARSLGKAARLARRGGPLARALIPEPPDAAARFGAFGVGELKRSVETSLKALRTDHLDLLLLHECSPADARRPEMLRLLEGLRDQGKILGFGIAARFDETLQIIAESPGLAHTAQFASDAANANVDRVRGKGPAQVITHTPLKEALPRLMARLASDPEAGRRWREAAGLEPGDRQGAAAVLLAEAAAQNPGGVVLFSTTRPERIRAAVEAVRTPPAPAVRRLLGELLDRTPAETFQEARALKLGG